MQKRGGHLGELPRLVDRLPRVRERDASTEEQHPRRGRQGRQGAGQGQAEQGGRGQDAEGRP